MPEIPDIDLHDVYPSGVYVNKQALQEDTCNIHPLREGSIAFMIDGVPPEQVSRMVEISQIIEDSAIVKCQPGNGIAIRKLEELFHSKYDAEQAILIRTKAKRQKYTTQITDIHTLVQFMLTHDVATNMHNKLARQAVIQRAKELGIDLGDIIR